MTSYGLTPNDIVNAVKAQNVQAAVGRIGAQPALPDQQFQLSIQTKGRLSTVDEFQNVVVRANPDGSFVRVKDVARVEIGARSSEQIGRQDGGTAAVISIYQSPGGNAIATARSAAPSAVCFPALTGPATVMRQSSSASCAWRRSA